MKLDDIFFGIGIIIIASLLVFVIYDDLTSNPYQDIMDEFNEINTSEKYNISENDTKLLPNNTVNNTVNIESSNKAQTTDTQISKVAKYTQKMETSYKTVQSQNTQDNNLDNEIKQDNKDTKHSSFSNSRNEKSKTQNAPSENNKKN